MACTMEYSIVHKHKTKVLVSSHFVAQTPYYIHQPPPLCIRQVFVRPRADMSLVLSLLSLLTLDSFKNRCGAPPSALGTFLSIVREGTTMGIFPVDLRSELLNFCIGELSQDLKAASSISSNHAKAIPNFRESLKRRRGSEEEEKKRKETAWLLPNKMNWIISSFLPFLFVILTDPVSPCSCHICHLPAPPSPPLLLSSSPPLQSTFH